MKLQKHDAAHLLRRFAFGATPSEVSRFTELNRQQAITQLFSAGIVEDTGLDLDQVGDISMTEAQDHWLAHLFDSLPNVRDRQLFFWHDHFSIIGRKVRSAELSWQAHNDMRRLAMGDFAPLLSAISFSPAMIVHLDNQTNVAGNPQENFARELLELHTVGVGNFSESDVITMAQAWTGHGLSGSRSAGDLASFFYEARHDSSVNTMFGREASWSAHAALEELTTGVKAMDTARYLVAKVLSYYVGDHVTQDVVNDLAVMFRDSNMNMRELLRIVATLDEFWAPEARYCRVRNPLEYTIGLSRAVGVRPEETRLRGSMSRMGMGLFQPPGVDGWGPHTDWISTSITWTKEQWLRPLSIAIQENWQLAGMSQADAASELLERLGVYEPLPGTTDVVSQWFANNVALLDQPRLLQVEAVRFAGHLPEVQLS